MPVMFNSSKINLNITLVLTKVNSFFGKIS